MDYSSYVLILVESKNINRIENIQNKVGKIITTIIMMKHHSVSAILLHLFIYSLQFASHSAISAIQSNNQSKGNKNIDDRIVISGKGQWPLSRYNYIPSHEEDSIDTSNKNTCDMSEVCFSFQPAITIKVITYNNSANR